MSINRFDARWSVTLGALLVSACSEPGVAVRPTAPASATLSSQVTGAAGGVPERPERSMASSFFTLSDSALWRMGAKSDSVFSVGVRSPGAARGTYRGQWLVSGLEQTSRVGALRQRQGITVVGYDTSLPRIFVKVPNPALLASLRKEAFVDYVEPRRLPRELLSLSSFGGCGIGDNGNEYTFGPTGDEVPTSFIKARVDRAWAYANGSGVWLGIVDTGVNPSNYQLGTSQFTSGWSAGRAPLRQSNVIGGFGTGLCSHGTYMGAVAAAPRDGIYTQGVAWKANLHAITVETGVVNAAATDVTQGVLDATNQGSKVIAMALGVALHSSALTDAIQRAFFQYNVVVVAAAGTSPASVPWHTWFVVYPANLSEVMAASAANYDGTRDNQSHTGAELDIVSYQPTTTSSYNGYGHYNFGNSSNATAMVAGVAALIRQRFPSISADSVRRRIINTAGTRCGSGTTFGPILNAEAAVGGVCVPFGAPAGPPSLTFDRRAYGDNRTSQTAQYCVTASGGAGPLQITWQNGAQGTCRTVTFQRGTYTQRVGVDVRDLGAALPALTVFVDVSVVDLDTICPTCV